MANRPRDGNFVPTIGLEDESTGEQKPFLADNTTGRALVDSLLSTGTASIGNVKIEDGNSTTKLDVESDGTKNAAYVQANDLDIRDLTSVSDSVEAKQSTHDDLNCNANMQIGDADVGGANPVPVSGVEATGINGGDVSVGTTQVEMSFTGTTKCIQIQSKVANTGSIWVGLTGVTNSGSNAFAQLSAGQSVSIELNDASAAIYAISDTASQTVYKVAVT
ncbi:MAG: hypothetical protein GY861_03260 [bacterium]|nr:hypothetical protein [bacterium]